MVAGLLNVGAGHLVQGVLIFLVGKTGVENIHRIQLGNPGGHGAGAKQGFVGGNVELVVCQGGDGRLDEPGHGNGGDAVFLHGFEAVNHLHGSAGIGKDDSHILGRGVSGLNQLGMPVLVEDGDFVNPQQLQIQVLGGAEGGADAEQIDYPGILNQLHAFLEDVRVQQRPGLLQGQNIPVGNLLHNLLHSVHGLNLLFLGLVELGADSQLLGNGLAEGPVAGIADVAAQPDDGGGGGKGSLCQFVNAQLGYQLGSAEDLLRNRAFRGAEVVGCFPEFQQGTGHGGCLLSRCAQNEQKVKDNTV